MDGWFGQVVFSDSGACRAEQFSFGQTGSRRTHLRYEIATYQIMWLEARHGVTAKNWRGKGAEADLQSTAKDQDQSCTI